MKKDLDIYKKLTGSHQVGLEENSRLEPNAEIEGTEYMMYPDGEIVRGHGDKHSKGGVKVHIPDGTKILSAHLKLDKGNAKALTKELGFKVSTKDTYSTIMDKYKKNIGIDRIDRDQEELFKELQKKVTDADYDQTTKNINRDYLSGKIYELETEKRGKLDLKAKMFDRLFTIQENSKPAPEKMTEEQFFKKGGISKAQYNKLLSDYNLTDKQGRHLVLTGKMIPKYSNGAIHGEPKTFADVDKALKAGDINGIEAAKLKANIIQNRGGARTIEEVNLLYETGHIGNEEQERLVQGIRRGEIKGPIKFSTSSGKHKYSQEEIYKREKNQHAGEGGFGILTKENLPEAIELLYRNFPDIVSRDDVFGAHYDSDGNFVYNEDIDFSKQRKEVLKFQELADKRMRSTAKSIIDNPGHFLPEEIENAKNFLETQTFDKSTARGFDQKFGQFTSGRFNLGVDVVTPEEYKDIQSKGIYTTRQLREGINSGDVKLSPTSLARFERISEIQGEDSDFTINPIEGVDAPAEAPPAEEKPDPEKDPTKPITDDVVADKGKKKPTYFLEPDQMPLPPSPLQAHLKTDIRLQRIDPVRVGIENIKQQADEGLKQATAQLDGLPPAQRAAAVASLQATYQKNINDAIHKADVVNANNISRAELFNIGQAAEEEKAQANSDLDFERRQFRAMANTEEDVRRYYDRIRQININSFRNQQEMNLLNDMYENFNINAAGTSAEYEKGSGTKTEDNTIYKYLQK